MYACEYPWRCPHVYVYIFRTGDIESSKAMTTAIKQINKTPGPVCMECVGYLLEDRKRLVSYGWDKICVNF